MRSNVRYLPAGLQRQQLTTSRPPLIADAERLTDRIPNRARAAPRRAAQRSESRHHDRMHAGHAGLMEGAGHLAGALRFQGEIDGLRAPTEFRLAPDSSLRPQLREILADRERPYYEH
ncbi:hypothetical protein [Burkholderia stagnalis]|uniref:hypothetical protein n=1 Tax=Burkholderia stagnalis TaxID=1503054 RepID=UPI000F5FE3FE|nr:hypothetical protein [Burkholderia stagnalis]